jgi:hypothetical protein
MRHDFSDDEEDNECPLCVQELDLSDRNFLPWCVPPGPTRRPPHFFTFLRGSVAHQTLLAPSPPPVALPVVSWQSVRVSRVHVVLVRFVHPCFTVLYAWHSSPTHHSTLFPPPHHPLQAPYTRKPQRPVPRMSHAVQRRPPRLLRGRPSRVRLLSLPPSS